MFFYYPHWTIKSFQVNLFFFFLFWLQCWVKWMISKKNVHLAQQLTKFFSLQLLSIKFWVSIKKHLWIFVFKHFLFLNLRVIFHHSFSFFFTMLVYYFDRIKMLKDNFFVQNLASSEMQFGLVESIFVQLLH